MFEENKTIKTALNIDHYIDGKHEVVYVPWGSYEQFIFPTVSGGETLKRFGIRTIGLSDVIPPYHVKREKPRFYVVIIPLEGQCEFFFDNEKTIIRPGQCLICPKDVVHEYFAHERLKFIWLHINNSEKWQFTEFNQLFQIEINNVKELEAEFRRLQLEKESNLQYSDGIIAATTQRLVYDLVRVVTCGNSLESRRRKDLNNLWSEVTSDLSHHWNVEELATLFGMSINRFAGLVKKTEGQSVMEKVRSLKMIRAQELVDSGVYTLDYIALLLGFSTPFALSKSYKKYFGHSPYKKELK